MNRRKCAAAVSFALAFSFWSYAFAADVPEALLPIEDAAKQICGSVAASGGSGSEKANGEIKAELSGLAKRLADLGVAVSAEVAKTEYAGVLQAQLADTLKDERACKQHVFDVLIAKIPSASPHDPELEARLEVNCRNNLGVGTTSAMIWVLSKFQRSGLTLKWKSESSVAMYTFAPLNGQGAAITPLLAPPDSYYLYIRQPWGQYQLSLQTNEGASVAFSYQFEGEP